MGDSQVTQMPSEGGGGLTPQQATLRAARNLLRQSGGDLQALPPKLQRAILLDQQQRNAAGHARMRAAHAAEPPAEDPHGAADQVAFGLSQTTRAAHGLHRKAWGLDGVDAAQATERDLHQTRIARFEQRLAQQNPQRHAVYTAQQARAARDIARDADPDTWRRREVERHETQRSQELLSKDEQAWKQRLSPVQRAHVEQRQHAALESIQQSSAPDAADRLDVAQQSHAHEHEQLARDAQAWMQSLPPDRRRALEARHLHDDASIAQSGLEAVHAADAVKDVATFGAHTASKHEGVAGAAAELVTLGSYGLTRDAGLDLGRASAYAEQGERLRRAGAAVDAGTFDAEAQRLGVSGGVKLGLGAVNLAVLKGAGTRAAEGAASRGSAASVAAADGAGAQGIFNTAIVMAQRQLALRSIPWVVHENPGYRMFTRGTMSDLLRESEALGTHFSQFEGAAGVPVTVTVHGNASQAELAVLGKAINAAPPAARAHMREIHLSRELGFGERADGQLTTVQGLSDGKHIVINRDVLLQASERDRSLLYHEAGHVLDAGGRHSSRGPWGRGASVTRYGATNAAEDFAETHAKVLLEHQRLKDLKWYQWLVEDHAAKKAEILRLYGIDTKAPQARDLVIPAMATAAGIAWYGGGEP